MGASRLGRTFLGWTYPFTHLVLVRKMSLQDKSERPSGSNFKACPVLGPSMEIAGGRHYPTTFMALLFEIVISAPAVLDQQLNSLVWSFKFWNSKDSPARVNDIKPVPCYFAV